MLGLRTFFAALALLTALSASAKTSSLSPQVAQLIALTVSQMREGEMGSRQGLRYFRDRVMFLSNLEGDVLRERCELILEAVDPGMTIARDAELAVKQKSLIELYEKNRQTAPLAAVTDFHGLSGWTKSRLLREILSHSFEIKELIWRSGKNISPDRVIEELLALPYDETEKQIDEEFARHHWGAKNAGPELNSTVEDMRTLSFWLGPELDGKFVDIGSGYGVPAVLLSHLQKKPLDYLGLELMPEKIRQARRLAKSFAVTTAEFRETDLSKPGYVLPDGKYYYMFNPVGRELTDSLLKQLNEIGARKKIFVILNTSWGNADLLTNFEIVTRESTGPRRSITIFSSKK